MSDVGTGGGVIRIMMIITVMIMGGEIVRFVFFLNLFFSNCDCVILSEDRRSYYDEFEIFSILLASQQRMTLGEMIL